MIVLSLVLIGLAITLEPIPLTAFILVLASKGGVRKGAAFIFGHPVHMPAAPEIVEQPGQLKGLRVQPRIPVTHVSLHYARLMQLHRAQRRPRPGFPNRSEERRVGKEGRT